MKMVEFLKHLVTEKDNQTFCPVRIGAAGVAVVYHITFGYMVHVQHTPVDMSLLGAYINHMSMLIGVGAAGIGGKSILQGDAPIQ